MGGNFCTPPNLVQGHRTGETSTPPTLGSLWTISCVTLVAPNVQQHQLISSSCKDLPPLPHQLQRPKSRQDPKLRKNNSGGNFRHLTTKPKISPRSCPLTKSPPPRLNALMPLTDYSQTQIGKGTSHATRLVSNICTDVRGLHQSSLKREEGGRGTGGGGGGQANRTHLLCRSPMSLCS